MGLPRFLADAFDKEHADHPWLLLVHAFLAAAHNGKDFTAILRRQSLADGRIPNWHILHVARCGYQWRFASFNRLRPYPSPPDGLERVASRLYIGLLQQPSGGFIPEYRDVTVARFFLDKLTELNARRQAADEARIRLVQKIAAYRSKVYASRTFPPTLRALIFERDEYRCQNCIKDRSTLAGLGLHLTVDHKVADIDGGKTTYDNGETLCSECNIAKHHSKHYFQALASLRKP